MRPGSRVIPCASMTSSDAGASFVGPAERILPSRKATKRRSSGGPPRPSIKRTLVMTARREVSSSARILFASMLASRKSGRGSGPFAQQFALFGCSHGNPKQAQGLSNVSIAFEIVAHGVLQLRHNLGLLRRRRLCGVPEGFEKLRRRSVLPVAVLDEHPPPNHDAPDMQGLATLQQQVRQRMTGGNTLDVGLR